MRLKINKASDLSSISVLPPPSRRLSAVNSGPGTSILGSGSGGAHASQVRSQPSQQSFSQGISSQQGMFSQFSQSSHDEVVTADQRFGSQERDHPAKRFSCLAPPTYSREESQMPISRSSNNVMRKWSSNSSQELKYQSSEEFEHRLTVIETSVSRIGMILDSVQSDAMQGNKGTKELSIQLEVLRQKTTALDESIHLLSRRQEDIKSSLEGGLKSIFDQLNKSAFQDKSQEILPVVRTLPDQIEGSLQRVKNELWKSLSSELQEITCSLKTSNQQFTPALLQPKLTGRSSSNQQINPVLLQPKLTGRSSSSQMLTAEREPVPVSKSRQEPLISKPKVGAWTSVKGEKGSFDRKILKENKNKRISSLGQNKSNPWGKEWTVLIDSDEENDEDCSIFRVEKEAETYLTKEAKEETERILRKARRRKRRNTIVIN